MAQAQRKEDDLETIEAKLNDGHYDRLLDTFLEQIDEAAQALRRYHAAMRAENTLRS